MGIFFVRGCLAELGRHAKNQLHQHFPCCFLNASTCAALGLCNSGVAGQEETRSDASALPTLDLDY